MSKLVGSIQEGAGFLKEEAGEKLGDKQMARDGRKLRNKGKIKQGKRQKLTEPGTGN